MIDMDALSFLYEYPELNQADKQALLSRLDRSAAEIFDSLSQALKAEPFEPNLFQMLVHQKKSSALSLCAPAIDELLKVMNRLDVNHLTLSEKTELESQLWQRFQDYRATISTLQVFSVI